MAAILRSKKKLMLDVRSDFLTRLAVGYWEMLREWGGSFPEDSQGNPETQAKP